MSVLKAIVTPFLIILLLICSLVPLSAQINPPRHYQVKAAFLYNFTQFVEWPASAFPDDGAPVSIGIVGEDPFGPYLDEVVAGENMNGHPLIVQRFNPDDEIRDCHILFINLPNKDKTAEIIESINGKNILTVSDMPDFLQNGGMVRFIT
ncbi:MAG: YfiR family protein, partial [Anditalea sp.]